MGIAAMILGIISLVPLLISLIPLPLPIPLSGIMALLAIGSSAAVVGLILGIFALLKSKPNKSMAVAGVAMCSLGIIISVVGWIIVAGG